MLPLETSPTSDQMKPALLPPMTVKARRPLGGTLPASGAMCSPAETATSAAAAFPSKSATGATSVTPPVAPAV